MEIELKSDALFPEDVMSVDKPRQDMSITRKVTAYDFACKHGRNDRYNFGLDKKATAATLRELADRIENGLVLPQRAQVTAEADRADYSRSVLIFEFIENNAAL